MREGERLLLLDDLTSISWRPKLTPGAPEEERRSLDKQKTALQHAVRKNSLWPPILKEIHEQARALLWGLLDGQTVLTPRVTLPQRPLRLNKAGFLEEGLEAQEIKDRLMVELVALLQPHQPFPFRRCPVCQTVFVPVKRQKFCSPNCTYKSIETNRKEEKRKYMRDYMAKRRKRAKATRK
ncbi:MAG: hypothetical protein ACRERD_33800 [Candidatus Binatia bacterium]